MTIEEIFEELDIEYGRSVRTFTADPVCTS